MEEKNQKKFLVLKIIAFESQTTNSHNSEQDTWHWQSIYYEKPLAFNIWVKEIFCKLCFLRVLKKYDEITLMQILQEFDTF